MLTYSEYYNLVKIGLTTLKNQLEEAIQYTEQEYQRSLQKENEDQNSKDNKEKTEKEEEK